MKKITAVIACLLLLPSARAQVVETWGKKASNWGKQEEHKASNSAKQEGRKASNSVKQEGHNIRNAPANSQTWGKKHTSQSHQQQPKPTQHDTKPTQKHPKPDQQKAGTHKTDQKLGTHKPGQNSKPPVSTGQKDAQRTVQPGNANAPILTPGVLPFGNTNQTPITIPGTPAFNESLIPWQDAYPKPIYNGQLTPTRPGVLGVQIRDGGQGGGNGGTYTNKSGVQPPILQDPAAAFSKVFFPF